MEQVSIKQNKSYRNDFGQTEIKTGIEISYGENQSLLNCWNDQKQLWFGEIEETQFQSQIVFGLSFDAGFEEVVSEIWKNAWGMSEG